MNQVSLGAISWLIDHYFAGEAVFSSWVLETERLPSTDQERIELYSVAAIKYVNIDACTTSADIGSK
jgi:hypothetical protein